MISQRRAKQRKPLRCKPCKHKPSNNNTSKPSSNNRWLSNNKQLMLSKWHKRANKTSNSHRQTQMEVCHQEPPQQGACHREQLLTVVSQQALTLQEVYQLELK